jgi:predicted nucleic acid-binding protein
MHYIKYDALIVACAKRHNAKVLVTTDGAQTKLAVKVGLEVRTPSDFLSTQQEMYEAAPKAPPERRRKT